MYTLEDTFKLCDESRTLLDRVLGDGPAVTCTRSFMILPLRHAAVCGTPSQLRMLPKLPAHLQRPAAQTGALQQAGYAIRLIREGFLYLLVCRNGTHHCESQFRVEASGQLSYIVPENPWRRGGGGVQDIMQPQWLIELGDIDGIDELRMLFSPDPVTPEVLKRYTTDPEYRNTLQRFDVRQLAYSCVNAPPGVLTRESLDLIAEHAAQDHPHLKELLAVQAFAPGFMPFAAARAALAPLAGKTVDRGVGLVVDDAIGITQSLNAWRNDSMRALEAFMQRTDAEGLDNHRKFTIAFAIDNLKETLADQAEQGYLDHERRVGVVYTDPSYELANRQVVLNASGNYRRYRNPAHQQQVQQAEINKVRRETWTPKYAQYVDEAMRQAFLQEYRAAVEEADQNKDVRAADHLAWFASTALLDALKAYDRDDMAQGILFEAQLSKASLGMDATEQGAALLDAWCQFDISPANLFWRGLAQNQAAIEEEMNKVLTQRSHLPSLDDAALLNLIKGLAALYEKSHALAEALHANGQTGPPASRFIGAVLLVNTFGNRLFQSKAASVTDHATQAALSRVLQSRLGRFAHHYQLEARGGKPLGPGALGRIDRAANRGLAEALRAGVKGSMMEVRIGSLLTVLEVWNLSIKAERAGEGSREFLEFTAASLGVMAAGLELGAAAVGFSEKSTNMAVQQGAKVFRSGLRLSAGVAAGGAAAVGAAFDIKDSVNEHGEKRTALASLYILRATAQVGTSLLSFSIGLAASAPFLEYLINRHGSKPIWGAALRYGASASVTLALRMAFMLRWCITMNLATIALTIAVQLLAPDALEKYLERCSFRKDKKKSAAETEAQEVNALINAIKDAL